MPWFKVDDTLAFHGKVVAAGNAAIGMWARAGAWSQQTLTGGKVPDHMVSALGNPAQAKALVASGLWEKVDGGYLFHDWDQYQPSKESVEADRAAAKERQRRARERAKSQRDNADSSQGSNGVSHGVTQPLVTVPPTRPDPSLVPTGTNGTSRRGSRLSAEFEVTDHLREWADKEAPNVDVDRETQNFNDYWTAATGQAAVKLDWPATWRKWMRKESDKVPRRDDSRSGWMSGNV